LETPGPVLLVPNHQSWIDWLFLIAHVDTRWRFVTSATTAQTSFVHRFVMVNRFTFPIDTASPYAVKHMAEHLQAGGRLVLFAEGRMSRTGSLMKLYEGTGFLLLKTGAKVITCYLRGAERIPFARHAGWKRWFTPVSVHYGEALMSPACPGMSTTKARTHLTIWLRDQMLEQQMRVETTFGPRTVPEAILAAAAARPKFVVMQDFTMQGLPFRRLVVGAELLAGRFAGLLETDARVGVLLPNTNAMPVALLGLWMAGKIPAILNYTTGPVIMLACVRLAALRTVITSRQFLTKGRLKVDELEKAGIRLIYLEDVRASLGAGERLFMLVRRSFHMPLRLPRMNPDPAAIGVVLFTSGSEGEPKGVALTQANLMANIRQMMASLAIQDDERFFNALPMFHSFGLTVGTLLPLTRGVHVFLFPSPLQYRLVPELFYDRACTVMLATNTFLNGYARKAHPYDFHDLRYLFAGAEKVQEATTRLYADKYGVRVLEGYGATECSPAISVNTPMMAKPGSAGRLMPGMEWRLEPVEGVAEGGRLFVRGPNVMSGYLNPEANARFLALQGWYDTGDIVTVDEDRFIFILGRLKRFAKISGEMVSLSAVEEALAGAFPQYGLRCQIAILSRPDAEKGEMLIAVSNEPRLTLEEIRAQLKAKGLPNLCVPREVRAVKEIPKLGTGKVNHRELQRVMAEEGK
jgi:acyl-[acyl-carrier-protein]-phospholipid O-acyltransferase/long-chain-fatty-acid--[acyl-carrier-protein] ligase